MTATKTASISSKLEPSQNHQDRQFRALDRALARRYVEELMQQSYRRQRNEPMRPRMEICDDPAHSRVTAYLELPGLKSSDVSVQLDGARLVISGERRSHIPPDIDQATANARFPVRELKYGKFLRVITVPTHTMMSTISASMSDGMLILSWPRSLAGNTPADTRKPSGVPAATSDGSGYHHTQGAQMPAAPAHAPRQPSAQ
ncbi:HSP20-like chaperone [Coniophora puteana RWD-64-598 SS2]|uniref:HSP20-like chaperone n=1 Tax=Coniophora puteana (strain RWD-64-598) TaxID=741705 RepID=A0A5M3MLL5_CONPW|nr:HSP20-like chaperone [Coniophora puteana RWD-64-598 SS2]EIW79927.1 HSP20-like chaperone [Coniophora puteana RWD-64-598 SS2]